MFSPSSRAWICLTQRRMADWVYPSLRGVSTLTVYWTLTPTKSRSRARTNRRCESGRPAGAVGMTPGVYARSGAGDNPTQGGSVWWWVVSESITHHSPLTTHEPRQRENPQGLADPGRRGDEPGAQVDRAPAADVGPQHRAEGERVVRGERPAVDHLDPDRDHVPVGRAEQVRPGPGPGQRPGVDSLDQQEPIRRGQPGRPAGLFDLDAQAVRPPGPVQGCELVGRRARGPRRVPPDPQVRRPVVRRGRGHQP